MESESTINTDELVATHQDFVRAIARGIARALPRRIEFEDLVAYGQIGLLEAARRYEQGHNTTFTTFAHYRVRGAIYDGLRKLHGRGIELDANAIAAERGDELLEAGFGDGSSVDDLAGELSDAIDGVTTAALLAEHAADALSGTSPARLAEQRELVERLRAAVARLTPDERELTVALYRDGRSITDVARTRGCHKATTCRAHQSVLERLRRELDPHPGSRPTASLDTL